MLRKVFILIVSIAMTTMVVGCNTFKGVGKDVQSGGKAITNTAENVSEKM
ncbi:entericidin A/B family lipoprotein [Gilliamella sp. W8126]|uniref:Entericidin n=1 Tax=Gilliamella apis TaxID=1970738 RepID=A0A2V4DX45_9GAMM|nr:MULTISPECIES: entericidin A/B family lipoprotein [Gilliamella]MBI0006735.1 entericidin A/B family lipoprotein [Gilliamella sp. W8126]MBI0038535.1 entericidin A/B family lipoprotein [Gilliamella sp. B14384G10]MBI0040826.1 entericidin A/B family lipoprotein [Gilliamella sp. B14384G7]MBI0052525.1 entericidin A/B family lipoprotein [Gilliamella sp. B14384G13]MBI0054820.1 entericidin A/B family lipoprotein [Gilliamella sp. B14384H2]